LLAAHNEVIRDLVGQHRGRLVKSVGDGVLATFDGPARAVTCACAVQQSVQPLGLSVRAGLHTGEVEVLGDDIGGIAVHIGARVAAEAGPGEVLVSRTIRDLVAGSGLVFEDRGAFDLKGLPDRWQLFAVSA
jgi:class 3 adenylate cyclase